MQVQINLGRPFEYRAGGKVPSFDFCGDLVVVTDPGKTNMAMVVGTVFGTRLCVLQFRAPGSAYDTSDYCHDFKTFLTEYFKGCNIAYFGIEKAISKQGMNHHHSSMVLTEIRANLIDLAYDLTGKKPIEINNWSWKYAILPDGYRSQSEKGSARFLVDVYKSYGNADVTDAVCMFEYLYPKYCAPYTIFPDKSEAKLCDYKIRILPKGHPMTGTGRRFRYEPGLSLDENCRYFANRTWEKGIALAPISALTLPEIYDHAIGFSSANVGSEVEVVVVRC